MPIFCALNAASIGPYLLFSTTVPERPVVMSVTWMFHLWQLDIAGGVPLADGREAKLVTGIDDHLRFVVIAAVVAVPTGRAVCEAFAAAMRRNGVPLRC